MTLIIGFTIVIASVIGGLYIGGGSPLVLLHIAEYVIVLGICLGILVIASPLHVLKAIMGKIKDALRGGTANKEDYVDQLKMLYQVFMLARREGIIAIEDHVNDPANSPLLQEYRSFTEDEARVEFFRNSFRPVIDGKVKPEQLRDVLNVELKVLEKENDEPVRVLSLVGDSFPGVGICAAVLGIILTMGSVAEGPEVVGYRVAAALTGTFLGVYGAYGFINPMTALIEGNNANEMRYYDCMATAITSFASGFAPLMAVEIARRGLESHVKPGADELEEMLRAMPAVKNN